MGRGRPPLRPEDKKLLSKSRMFRALTPELKTKLLQAAEPVTVPPDTVLWRRGQWPTHVYIVLSGRVGLFDAFGDDGTAVIDLFPPGSVIAGGPILKEIAYTFSGRTVDEVRALRLPAAIFRRWLLSDHSLLLGTARDMIDQWRRLTTTIRDLKELSANQRLGCYLLALTDKTSGAVRLRLKDDLVLTARILGVTRESLSRSFAQLRAYGVSKRAKHVVIADIARLRAYCELRHH